MLNYLWLALYPVLGLLGLGGGYYLGWKEGNAAWGQLDALWLKIHMLPQELRDKVLDQLKKV